MPEGETVEQFAQRLREAYVRRVQQRTGNSAYGKRQIPSLDGGQDRHGRNHTNQLLIAAQILYDRGVKPDLMVRLRMPDWKASHAPPIAFFSSPDALARYGVGVDELAERLKVEFNTSYIAFESAVVSLTRVLLPKGKPQQQIVRIALQDKARHRGNVIFRYCIAARLGFADIAEACEIAAARLYAAAPEAYDIAWGETIPARLKEIAKAKGVA